MNSIKTKSIQDLGRLMRNKSWQNYMLSTNFGSAAKSWSYLEAMEKGTRSRFQGVSDQQDSVVKNFTNFLFMKNQSRFVNSSKEYTTEDIDEMVDFNPVLDPVEVDEFPINKEKRDINYVEDSRRPSKNQMFGSSVKSHRTTTPKFLKSPITDGSVKQIRSASNYSRGNVNSANGNIFQAPPKPKSDFFNPKATNKRKASTWKAVDKQIGNAPKKNAYYNLATTETPAEQPNTSLFSMNGYLYQPPPMEKLFIFRRNYGDIAANNQIFAAPEPVVIERKVLRQNTPKPPIEHAITNTPYEHTRYEPEPTERPERTTPRKQMSTSARKPTHQPKTNQKAYSTKKKEPCEEDPCDKPKPEPKDRCGTGDKLCPHFGPSTSCSEKLKNPCGKKGDCEQPTRQDCETD